MATIQTFSMPTYLYRYRSFNNKSVIRRELSALKNGYVYTSPYDELNDPSEGVFNNETEESLKSIYNIFDDVSLLNNVGICSFSEVNDSILLWAHYASNFTGICIRYKLSDLIDALPGEDFLTPIQYRSDVIGIDIGSDPNSPYVALSQKYSAWSYEREWRLLSRSLGKVKFLNRINPIDCIFLGLRFPFEYEIKIKKICENMKIKIMDMKLSSYRVEFADYEEHGVFG